MSEPRVSVIIPCYNSAPYVGQAVQSVLEQSFGDLEVIVVNDGSTDDSRAVVAAMSDTRVYCHHQDNRGLGAARNAGLHLARGEFVAFLDADDTVLPDKLEWQVAQLDQAPHLGLVAGGYVEVSEEGRVLRRVESWRGTPGLDLYAWLFRCPFVVHSVLMRRRWIETVGGFDEQREMGGAADWDMWLRLAHAGCAMAWTPAIVCAYRFHRENMTREASRQKEASLIVLEKFFSRPDLSAEIAGLRERALAEAWVRGACREYGAGQTQAARKSLEQALRLAPELETTDRDHLLEMLLGWAGTQITGGDAQAYITTVFANLPVHGPSPRQAMARWEIGRFFRAYHERDRSMALRALLRAVARDPSCLKNRGVLAVAVRWLVCRRRA